MRPPHPPRVEWEKIKTVTMNLRPEVEARLEAEAEREHLPVGEYLAYLVEAALTQAWEPEIKTGTDLLAYWKSIGFVGMWADREDMADSTEYVSRQRRKLEEDIGGRLRAFNGAE